MTKETKDRITKKLEKRFSRQTALAAAINELLTMIEYPEYLEAICAATEQEIYNWCEIRGKLWEQGLTAEFQFSTMQTTKGKAMTTQTPVCSICGKPFKGTPDPHPNAVSTHMKCLHDAVKAEHDKQKKK